MKESGLGNHFTYRKDGKHMGIPMKPSICRMVIYTDHDGHENPAVVTSLIYNHEKEIVSVNLHVMIDGGGTKWVKDVHYYNKESDSEQSTSANSWRWPPRQ